MGCRLCLLAVLLLCAPAAGCVSLFTERGAAGGVDHAREYVEVREASVTYTEARVVWGDGLQAREIQDMAGSVGARVNRAFLEELQHRRQELELLHLTVHSPEAFSSPITMKASSLLDRSGLRVMMWRTPDPRGWSVALRHAGDFHVFQDSVEFQLRSVMTLFDDEGQTVWQGAARSRKHHDNWHSGEHLADLSARFVNEAVRDNVDELVAASQVESRE